jgi:hypothetical protein
MNFLPDLAQYALIVLLCKQQKETMVRASGTVIGIEKKKYLHRQKQRDS